MNKTNESTAGLGSSDNADNVAEGCEQQDSSSQAAVRDAEFSRAEFPSLEEHNNATSKPGVDLDLVLDIPVTMTMEVGCARLNIRNLLQLGRGSVVELDRLAGEPMDVKVNGVLVAHGEVVVVNEKFGIRLTNVARPAAPIV